MSIFCPQGWLYNLQVPSAKWKCQAPCSKRENKGVCLSLLCNVNLPLHRNARWANADPPVQGIQGSACPASPVATTAGLEWGTGADTPLPRRQRWGTQHHSQTETPNLSHPPLSHQTSKHKFKDKIVKMVTADPWVLSVWGEGGGLLSMS